MCSIPGLPTPGSQVTVIISRANLRPTCGLLELWVQMDDGRKSYDQMKEEIQIPGRKFQGSEGKPEDLCLVLISKTWHRARIVSLQNDIYNVFLIDQGKAHNATSEDLAWAHPDSLILPPEVESCILANVFFVESNWPEKATKFLLSLSGMKFTGQVQHVLMPDRITLLDIPVVSMHLCKLGVTKTILKEEEFKCLALKWQHLTKAESSQSQSLPQEENLIGCNYQLAKQDQYFSPQLSTGNYEVVIVTEITDELDVFCKLHIFSKEIKMLSKRIFQEYEGSTHCNEEMPKTIDVPCATKGSDGKWHRSLLKQDISATDTAVTVLQVDSGKTEIVPIVDIRPLYGKFQRMPVFTYLCSLAGVTGLCKEWTADDRAILKSLLLNKKVVARFDQLSVLQDNYDVMLYAPNGSCINDCIIEKTGLTTHLISKSANALNQSVLSLFLNSLKNQQYLELQTSSFAEERKMEHEIKSVLDLDISTNKSIECLDPLMRNENPSTEVQNTCDDYGLPVGSRVAVKVSCIESPDRFWCQKVDSNDLLENLKEDLQTYYASAQSRTFAESFYVARNPDDNMWYRAQIIVNSHSPVIDVRFIDCGKTQKVHLHDVRPINPTFLSLCPQAFQCCLFNMTNPTNPFDFPDAASTNFQKFVSSITSSQNELDCFVKAVEIGEQGQCLHMVDIETKSYHVDKHLAEKFDSPERNVLDPPQVPCESYSFSSHNIEVGMEDKIWVTFSETVNHFYCQLDRSSGLFDRVMEDLGQHLGKPQCSDQPLGLNNVCIAKYTDDKWYRGQIMELYPKVKVQFVDYGEAHIVNEKDVCHFPSKASIARSTPVLAIPLGLSNITEVPEGINKWFADQAIGQEFTMSVVAIGEKGKLIVDLFSATGHVNEIVRQKVVHMKKHTVTGLRQQNEEPVSTVSELSSVQEEEASPKSNDAPKKMPSNLVHKSDAMHLSHELTINYRMQNNVTVDKHEQLELNCVHKDKESLAVPSEQSFHNGLKEQQQFHSTGPNIFKWPNVSQNKIEESFASTISGPQYFWCQNSNAEKLIKMSEFTRIAGKAAQDVAFELLEVGSACLALFSDDNRWYRAQVIKKGIERHTVLFVDYGNESEVDRKNVKAIPQSLLDIAPHAILCCLTGFVESQGSWDDDVYDAFYHLLIDKPFKLTMLHVKEHPEIRVPQYLVEINCESTFVNTAMLKYWKPRSENDSTESLQKDNIPQCGQTELSLAHFSFSEERLNTSKFKEPDIFKIKTHMLHASCISEPNFFWCQFTDTDRLSQVSELAQEAGKAAKVEMTPENLVTGSPCLALFSSDNIWYRAQIIGKSEDLFNILFIDYGNECVVDIERLKTLPQSLLDIPPQAFLCCLNGFEESNGSWDDEVYDEFYNFIVDKSLKVTVNSIGNHLGVGVPQYAIEIECEGVFVNTLMRKYWKCNEPNKVLTGGLKSAVNDKTSNA